MTTTAPQSELLLSMSDLRKSRARRAAHRAQGATDRIKHWLGKKDQMVAACNQGGAQQCEQQVQIAILDRNRAIIECAEHNQMADELITGAAQQGEIE